MVSVGAQAQTAVVISVLFHSFFLILLDFSIHAEKFQLFHHSDLMETKF